MQKEKSVIRVEVIDGLEIFVPETEAEKFRRDASNSQPPVKEVRLAEGQSGGSGIRRMNLGGDKDG